MEFPALTAQGKQGKFNEKRGLSQFGQEIREPGDTNVT